MAVIVGVVVRFKRDESQFVLTVGIRLTVLWLSNFPKRVKDKDTQSVPG